MFLSVNTAIFDKAIAEPWDEYVERKVKSLSQFFANDGGEYFDFGEHFHDKNEVEIGYEFCLTLEYDGDYKITDMRCYCQAVGLADAGGHRVGEPYVGDNLDEIKARLVEFVGAFNEALGLTFSFDALLESDLNGEYFTLFSEADRLAWSESLALKASAREMTGAVASEEGLSL